MSTRIKKAVGPGSSNIAVFPPPIIADRAPTATDEEYPLGQKWIYNSQEYTFMGSSTWDVGGVGPATTTTEGVVLLDTDGTLSSADNDHVPTSLAVKTYADSIAIAGGTVATEIAAGIGELATDAEAVAGTPSTAVKALFITPSNLAAVFAAPPATGGTTPAAGSFSTLSATGAIDFDTGGSWESGGTAIDIGADASGDAINLGTGAAARTVTIGNVTGATAVNVNVGTGNFALEGDVASTYSISATGANTGTVTIGAGTGARTVNLATGGTGVKTVNIATGAIGNVVTIGTVTGAASLDLKVGTGNFTLEGATASTYTISGTGANTGTIAIGTGTGAQTLNLMTGGTGVKTLNIGTGAIGNVITIGTVTGAASLDLKVGTGNFTLEGATASTYTISGTGANTGTIAIGTGTGAQTLNLMTGGTGVKTVNIATGAIGNVVTIGTVTGAASLDLKAGTGNFTLEGATATTYTISGTGANTGTITIGGGTGTQTLNLMTGAGSPKTLNIGTGAVANVLTIGTVTGAASLDLKVGTGNFTLEGDVASTYAISSTGANTGTVTIASGTGARTVEIAGSTGGKTVNIAAGAGANIVTLGSVTGASSLDLKAGTGNFTLEGDVATTYDISATGINTGTVRIGSGTGARIVEIAGGGTGIKTINIGRGATADVISIGTTDGAGSLLLAAGTGNITVSGTVNAIASKYVVATGIDLTLSQSPILQSNATTGAAPTGATGDVNLMYLQEGVIMEQFILGAGQTIIAPRMTATGLNIALDQVDNEGAEYNFGAARANSKHAFTIGTSAAFRMDVTLTVADVSGCEPLLIGFRKSEANNATITSYTDYATIGLDNVAAVGNIVISTELNAGGTTNTDTTDAWADTASHKLSVLVSASGVVTYLIDDVAPTVTAAFTFDNGDVVCPFIHFLNGADIAGDVELEALKIGFQ